MSASPLSFHPRAEEPRLIIILCERAAATAATAVLKVAGIVEEGGAEPFPRVHNLNLGGEMRILTDCNPAFSPSRRIASRCSLAHSPSGEGLTEVVGLSASAPVCPVRRAKMPILAVERGESSGKWKGKTGCKLVENASIARATSTKARDRVERL